MVYLLAQLESATPTLLLQKNSSNLCKSHDPPWPRWGWHVPTRAPPWLRHCCQPSN